MKLIDEKQISQSEFILSQILYMIEIYISKNISRTSTTVIIL